MCLDYSAGQSSSHASRSAGNLHSIRKVLTGYAVHGFAHLLLSIPGNDLVRVVDLCKNRGLGFSPQHRKALCGSIAQDSQTINHWSGEQVTLIKIQHQNDTCECLWTQDRLYAYFWPCHSTLQSYRPPSAVQPGLDCKGWDFVRWTEELIHNTDI